MQEDNFVKVVSAFYDLDNIKKRMNINLELRKIEYLLRNTQAGRQYKELSPMSEYTDEEDFVKNESEFLTDTFHDVLVIEDMLKKILNIK